MKALLSFLVLYLTAIVLVVAHVDQLEQNHQDYIGDHDHYIPGGVLGATIRMRLKNRSQKPGKKTTKAGYYKKPYQSKQDAAIESQGYKIVPSARNG